MPDPILSDALALQDRILQEVREKTGMSFRLIDGMDTRDREIAHAVLPILATVVEKESNLGIRRAVFSRFHTPFAYPFFTQILTWWQQEEDNLARASLTLCIILLCKDQDAERVWEVHSQFQSRGFYYQLLTKLAFLRPTEARARNELVQALSNRNDLNLSDYSSVASVPDPRIQEWFAQHIESSNSHLRRLAQKRASRRQALPKGVEYASAPPDRVTETFSTEVDLEELGSALKEIAEVYQLKIPVPIRRGGFLTSVEVDRWLMASISSKDQAPATLWFRLEDIDTVEIVLFVSSAGTSQIQ